MLLLPGSLCTLSQLVIEVRGFAQKGNWDRRTLTIQLQILGFVSGLKLSFVTKTLAVHHVS